MSRLHSYSKVYALGHPYLAELLSEDVLVEEKIDGSQFSFGVDEKGELLMRSKGAQIFLPVQDNLFKAAAEYVASIQSLLKPGWTYRAEVLWRERHNEITYGRTPRHNLIIFDIDRGEQNYLDPVDKIKEAIRIDIETVMPMYAGRIADIQTLKHLLEQPSCLSLGEVSPKVEGIVVKNYVRFGIDKKTLMGKWVREEFKETQRVTWRENNPTKGDIIEGLCEKYRHENRWKKTVLHLREQGKLTNTPRDIGLLIEEIKNDLKAEEAEAIKNTLFNHAWGAISRSSVGGFPEWYKERLAESQFQTKGAA